MDTIQAIKSRVSIRKYKNQPISKEILEDIVDCGRLAPNGYNSQSWVFVVVTDPDSKNRIAQASRSGKFIKDAGACIAVFCRKDAETAMEDAAAATENMIIAAQANGLGTCWINVYKKANADGIKGIVNCPPEYELMTLFAIGYPNEEKTTSKKSLEEVMHWNTFK
jgi:nitroreductase